MDDELQEDRKQFDFFHDAVEPTALEAGKYFVREETAEQRKLYDPNGAWLANVGPEPFKAPVELDRDEIIEQLYNLDRKDLRRVAYEALLISDGPDHIDGDAADPAVVVQVGNLPARPNSRSITFSIWEA